MNAIGTGKIFCIGTTKTATSSIGAALERLGYKHHSYDEELLAEVLRGNKAAAIERARDFESFDDWPWSMGTMFVDLDQAFPGSRFIYTDRDLISWAASQRKYFYADPKWHYGDLTTFDDHFPDVIVRRRNRKRHIDEYFRRRPQDLLTMTITSGDGWEKLCAWLGREVPDEPFPCVNVTKG